MRDWPNELLTQHEAVLTWKRFAFIHSAPPCVEAAEIEIARDYVLDRMVLHAKGYVLGEQLPSHTETATGFAHFEAPASWWQHLKHQHGQRWWLRLLVRRRPVRMNGEVRSVTLTATWENMAGYPWSEYTKSAPGHLGLGRAVRLTWLTSTLDWSEGGDNTE